MNEIDDLYFNWLISQFEEPTISLVRLSAMLHRHPFLRRVGNDINRASDGKALRLLFIDNVGVNPDYRESLLHGECTWLEMLVALAEQLDFLYDGGLKNRFLEMIDNLGLAVVLESAVDDDGYSEYDEVDVKHVDRIVSIVNENRIDRSGRGGLFPLSKSGHPDQREVEIWDQQAAYISERLEGIAWTSTH